MDPTRFNTDVKPTWCPGCGNFGIHTALKRALHKLGVHPHEVVLCTGIGCSGKIAHWVNTYGLHGIHGRALPAATGVKLANHNLAVVAEGGDGDGYSEGLSHFIHACRRNLDLTYIVHNNGVFGLTTGQVSPTGERGFRASTTPAGSLEPPLNPVALALCANATYVARGYCGDLDHLSTLLSGAMAHPGFAFVDVLQVCVSYHPARSYAWYGERVYRLEDEAHDTEDHAAALALALDGSDRWATGLFYQTASPTYESQLPELAAGPLAAGDIAHVDIEPLFDDFS